MVLDLTAAFDMIDHGILVSHLEEVACIHGSASGLDHFYRIEVSLSICGVPQGCILAPVVFPLYILPLGKKKILENMGFHIIFMQMICKFICL